MRLLLTFILICFTSQLTAQHSISRKELEAIYTKLEQVIGEDWFLHPQPDGFDVYYCKSCQLEFARWKDSDTVIYFSEDVNTPFRQKDRYRFFSPEKADSMAYFPVLNGLAFNTDPKDSVKTNEGKRSYYKANGILHFQYRFERKWSLNDSLKHATHNRMLENRILEHKPVMLPHAVFEDYRYMLPYDYLKQYTTEFDFYFVQLPYSSYQYDYSIFLTIDDPGIYTEPLLVDKKDPWFFDKDANFLKDERDRTLLIISYVLGLTDFKIP